MSRQEYEMAFMSFNDQIARAAQTLSQMGSEADRLTPWKLANKIALDTGVDFEAAASVVLANRPDA